MPHAERDMEDSDSDYDPSKIPANHPKMAAPSSATTAATVTATKGSAVATESTSPTMILKSNAETAPAPTPPLPPPTPNEAIIHEAEKDWELIESVCSRPMFAQTEEVERALHLLSKWGSDAESRYGIETMTYLRRKIIGPAAEAKKTELNRILALRKQVNQQRVISEINGSPYREPSRTLPPIHAPHSAPQSPLSRPLQNGIQNGAHHSSNRVSSRPPLYQSTTERRPPPPTSAPSLPHPRSQTQSQLPPIHSGSPRPTSTYHPTQKSSQQRQPAHASNRGQSWIHSPESDLWCPLCRTGPLACMHSHRLIGRLFTRGIKHCTIEELQYTQERLEDWAYRGHPLKMEPAMTKMYSLEELAAEQKAWIAELRALLNHHRASQQQQQQQQQQYPQGHTNSRPTTTHQQSNHPQAYSNRSSVPSSRPTAYPERREEHHYSSHQAPNGYDAQSRGTPRLQQYSTPTAHPSPAVTHTPAPRAQDQVLCSVCPRNGPCIHKRDDRRVVVAQTSTPDQSMIDLKRKREATSSTDRRVKTTFRPDNEERFSSEDDNEDEDGPFPQVYPQHIYKKFDQVRSVVENMPKEQLSSAILRMCYSNTMILNWVKRELKKAGLSKDVIITGEATLITPTSTEGPSSKGVVSEELVTCSKCETSFDPAEQQEAGECQWHEGDLIHNKQSENPTRVWTCCGGGTSVKGCRSGQHSTKGQAPTSLGYSNGYSTTKPPPVLTNRPVARHLSQNHSTYPGQSLVQALADAEKKSERAANELTGPSSRVGGSSMSRKTSEFEALQDFSPSVTTLKDVAKTAFDVEHRPGELKDLSNDSDRHLLHSLELHLASQLQISCASYLCEKRLFFHALVEAMQDGTEFTEELAQEVCRIEPSKVRTLFQVYEKIGWLEPKHFMKYLNNPSGTMIHSIEMNRTCNNIDGIRQSGVNGEGRPNSAPDSLSHTEMLARRASSGSATAPITYVNHTHERERKQKSPHHLPYASSMFHPMHSPGHLHAPSSYSHPHGDQNGNTVNLTDFVHTPPRDVIMAGSPETYQWRKSGIGKKIQVPICPYPRSWAEADAVDRELVRLKRHDGKQWEELFEWWRAKGRASLKNASCLAVRYSILKKNYENDWIREGL